MTFLFFQSTRTDIQISCFACNIPYQARPKGPPFQFFSALRDFFSGYFFPKGSPLHFFCCFATEWMLENPKRSSLSVFRHCETFFRKFVFSSKGPLFNCDKNVDNFGSVPLLACLGLALAGPGAPLGPFFGFLIFKYCKLTLGSPFANFEPWTWRRFGRVPAC